MGDLQLNWLVSANRNSSSQSGDAGLTHRGGRQDQLNSPFRVLKPVNVSFVFSCSFLSKEEEHFSPEADSAVSEMTRGAVLVAQVGESCLEESWCCCSLPPSTLSVLKCPAQAEPANLTAGKGSCWEILVPSSSLHRTITISAQACVPGKRSLL